MKLSLFLILSDSVKQILCFVFINISNSKRIRGNGDNHSNGPISADNDNKCESIKTVIASVHCNNKEMISVLCILMSEHKITITTDILTSTNGHP